MCYSIERGYGRDMEYFSSTLYDFMSSVADIYDKICAPCSDERIEFFDNLLRRERKQSILDMSCSTGITCIRLGSLGYKMTGIDFAAGMIRKAKSNAKKNNILNCKFLEADMRSLELKEKYDLVYNNSLIWIDNLEDVSKTIDVVSSVLKENGMFVIDIPRKETLILGS